MLYIAAVLCALGLTLMGLDYGQVRWAHSAGVPGTALVLAALVLLVIKEARVISQHS